MIRSPPIIPGHWSCAYKNMESVRMTQTKTCNEILIPKLYWLIIYSGRFPVQYLCTQLQASIVRCCHFLPVQQYGNTLYTSILTLMLKKEVFCTKTNQRSSISNSLVMMNAISNECFIYLDHLLTTCLCWRSPTSFFLIWWTIWQSSIHWLRLSYLVNYVERNIYDFFLYVVWGG